jgi:hypothetical protein
MIASFFMVLLSVLGRLDANKTGTRQQRGCKPLAELWRA